MPKRSLHRVAVVVYDGVVLADFAIPCEVFGCVELDDGNRGYVVKVCGAASSVDASHCKLSPPFSLRILADADTIILPGIDRVDRLIPDVVLRAIRKAAARGARIASICTGAFVLAQTGLLDGMSATTHWLAAAALARRFPKISVDPDVLYIDNGTILSSAGAAAALDLCLHIVRKDYGAAIAARTARLSVMPLERAGGQAQFIAHEAPVNSGSLQPLLSWIAANLDNDLSVRTLARRASMSVRTLHRKFAEQVGTTPAEWVLRARIRHAQHLLEVTTLSVERIAAEAGFGSTTAFRDGFRAVVGTRPTAYRSAFVSPGSAVRG